MSKYVLKIETFDLDSTYINVFLYYDKIEWNYIQLMIYCDYLRWRSNKNPYSLNRIIRMTRIHFGITYILFSVISQLLMAGSVREGHCQHSHVCQTFILFFTFFHWLHAHELRHILMGEKNIVRAIKYILCIYNCPHPINDIANSMDPCRGKLFPNKKFLFCRNWY